MATQFSGPIGPFLDSVQQRQVPVTVFGSCDFTPAPGTDPNQAGPWVQQQLHRAVAQVVGQKMSAGQLTFRHLGTGDIAMILPEVVAASGLEQQGIRVGNLTLAFGIDGRPAQQPTPQQQAPQQPQQVLPGIKRIDAKINVGGFNIKASTDGGVDMQGLQNQAIGKAKSTVMWWAFGCGILLLVGIGVVGLGLYIWHAAATATTAGPGNHAAAAAGKWDGKTPFTCDGNDAISLSGVKANLASGTAVTAGGNCNLTLTDVDITAPTAISTDANAVVTVKGGSITGSTFAVNAAGLSKVNLTGTKVTGKTQTAALAKITGP